MIQLQTMVDVADNTGAKQAMVIRVLGGSTGRPGKPRLRAAGVGDLVICTVKKALPNSDFMKPGNHKARVVEAVVVRTKHADPPAGRQLRPVRPQRGGADRRQGRAPRHAHLRGGGPRASREGFHEDHLAGGRGGLSGAAAGVLDAELGHQDTRTWLVIYRKDDRSR